MTWKLVGGAIGCASFVMLLGCAAEVGDTEGVAEATAGVITSAISPPCDAALYDGCTAEDDDWSGTVHTAIFTCKWQNSFASGGRQLTYASCSVPSGYALVGGGAVIDGVGNPGALLQASYPVSTDLWLAQSSDLAVHYPHKLRAYAVGLRINGLSGSQLRSLLVHTDQATPSNQPTSATILVPSGRVAVGGGAWAPDGQFITHNFPIPPSVGGWIGYFTNPVSSNPGSGQVRLISLPKCLSQLGPCTNPPSGVPFNLASQMSNGVSTNGSGYRSAAAPLPDINAVITTVGGATGSTSPGRYLTQLLPIPTGGFAMNKDHWWADGAGVTAFAVSLKRL